MADAADAGLLPRSYFRAPRVPFDFRAVALALLGYLVYWGGGLLISEVLGKRDVPGAFLLSAAGIFEGIPYLGPEIGRFLARVFQVADLRGADYGFGHVLVGGVWFFAVWSFFAQGIHRITSLRIARDEGLSLGEALRFSWKSWPTMLLAPAIVAAAIGFFAGCNALAGLLQSIPFAGGLLAIVLVPLQVISTLLILLIGVGGILGLPVVGAAAAWERNGTLDALSRAFSYVFARPLQYFWNLFLVFLFTGIVLLLGSWFVFTLTKTADMGVISSRLTVLLDAPPQDNRPDSDYDALSSEAKDDYASYRAKSGYTPGRPAPNVEPFAKDFQTVLDAPAAFKLQAFVYWIFLNLIWLGVYAYALWWFIGASTSIYADLRADVDGTEEDEIFLEEEEEDLAALAEGGPAGESPPAGAPPSPPPSAPAEPAPPPAAPPADEPGTPPGA